MDCLECEKKQKRIEELERLLANMSDSFDALFPPDEAVNADRVDFVQEVVS